MAKRNYDVIKTTTDDNVTLALLHEWDSVVATAYPILNKLSGEHLDLKQYGLAALFKQPELFYRMSKSNQISKIYDADANLSNIRYAFRFMYTVGLITEDTEVMVLRQILLVQRLLNMIVEHKNANKGKIG